MDNDNTPKSRRPGIYIQKNMYEYTGVDFGGGAPLGLTIKGTKYVWPQRFFGK